MILALIRWLNDTCLVPLPVGLLQNDMQYYLLACCQVWIEVLDFFHLLSWILGC
jgi:hypothetical protein